MPGGRHTRAELDEHLDDLASGGAEIVAQQIGALDIAQTYLISLRRGQGQAGGDEQRRSCRDDAMRFHVVLSLVSMLLGAQALTQVVTGSRDGARKPA